MLLNVLLHLPSAQHVSDTYMPIIRSSRLYLCCYRMWCVMPWLLVVASRAAGYAPPATKALHTTCGNNASIVSSSWWWTYKCPKHIEQIISAMKHSVASSWFSPLRLSNCEFIFTALNTCERYDGSWWRNVGRQHSAEPTYRTMYIANVTTQFALMMDPLHLCGPDLSTETWNSKMHYH